MKQSHWGEKRPTRWLLLADKLSREREKRKQEPVIHLNEVLNMAEEFGVQPDELTALLQFHHNLGDFIHFNEVGLTDTVILCPQWLANMFRYCMVLQCNQINDKARLSIHYVPSSECW